MKYYTGLDVSMKTTSVCIVNENGKVILEDVVETDPFSIAKSIRSKGLEIEKIAIESGSISHWLIKELKNQDLPVVCIDSRKMSKVLSININKTDKNDARLIAEALRCGFYSEVAQKTDENAQIRILLSTRRTLINTLNMLKNTIRGHLKLFGLRLGSAKPKKFVEQVMFHIQNQDEIVKLTIYSLLDSLKSILDQLEGLEKYMKIIAKEDKDIELLCTIPGIGIITALSFKVFVGDPSRFKNARSVAAYFGMTPTQYSSGEVKRQGRISKCGNAEIRSLLNEAATTLMYRTKAWCKPKAWGLKLLKKKGHKKACMAVARKLCTILFRVLKDQKPFDYKEATQEKEVLAKAC